GAAEADAAGVNDELVVEAHGNSVAAKRLEDDRLDPVVPERLIAAREGAQVLDARDFEPDEVGGVVRDPLCVGVREAHAYRHREREAVHRRSVSRYGRGRPTEEERWLIGTRICWAGWPT